MALIKGKTAAAQEPVSSAPPRDCASLLRELAEGDDTVRRWAARDLVACPGASVALVARLRIETDASVREVILTTLTRLGDAAAVAGLVECLHSQDAALRNEAIEAMKQMPEAVSPIIRDLLQSQDSDIRIFTVNILESLRHPEVEIWLCEVIARDWHVNVCATAVDLLGEVGSARALAPLRELKLRFAGEPDIAFAADLAIKRILED